MTRLSIVIPMLGSADLMESGLVSVLENRPPACEVLLVLNGEYGNPYELDDEVRFITAPLGAGWAESCNLGVEQATADIVHLLLPGVEVTPHWTEAATRRFAQAEVAAVSPLVLDPRRTQRVIAAGVGYPGRRRVISGRLQAEPQVVKLPKTPILGPSRLAGFYRKSYLVALGGFAPALGDERADVDFALRMKQAGLCTVVEVESIVRAVAPKRRGSGFRQGLCAERLRLRHTTSLGREALTRPVAILTGLGLRLFHPLRAMGHFAGQLAAWCELPRHLRFRGSRRLMEERLAACREASAGAGVRHDDSHGSASHRRRNALRASA